MTLQERKTALIAEFESLSDEKLIIKLEKIIKELKLIEYENTLKPMTEDAFNSMIDAAVDDHRKGNVISNEDLINEVKSW
jgi:predicted ATP-grasp superfamily ATP-dependent carboligase